MKSTGLLPIFSALVLLFAGISASWPWPGKLDNHVNALLLPRQNQNNNDNNATTTTQQSDNDNNNINTSSTPSPSRSGSQPAANTTSFISSSPTGNATRTINTKTTPIDPRLPPGGVSLITPALIDGAQYYKVGDFVTFGWNYTSLSVTPSAIDILASCSLNGQTYTLTSNMSVQATGAFTWDTGGQDATATNPFPVASYTLIIHDSSQDVTDVPSAGYLAAYEQYVFGMYTGQPYTPLNEFKCATCSGALSLHEKQAFGVVVMTAAITIMSFTWFASGFGVFS